MRSAAAALACVGLAWTVAGCGWRTSRYPDWGVADLGRIKTPFAHVSMSVSRLSRFQRGEEGELVVVAYVELLDAWGDRCKGAGVMELRLEDPSGASTGEAAELRWVFDLANLEENARYFDRATRSYRLPMRELPAWVASHLERRASARVRLVAEFLTVSPTGEEALLTAEGWVDE